MKKSTKALSITLALFMTCAGVFAQEQPNCKKCLDEKIQVYAHPSLMNADAIEFQDANSIYRVGGKVLKQKNRLGFTNKDNLYVNAFSKDLLNAMSVRKGDKDFNIKMPISRAELAFMLSQGLDMEQVNAVKDYTDITNSYWASEEIKTATAADVMIGYPDKSFKPDQAITKAEVFATIAKLIDVEYANDNQAPALNGKKIKNIPTWAYGCTKEVIASGLINNLPDEKTLLESQYLSRHQVAVLVSELRLNYAANGKLVGDAFKGAGTPVALKVKMLDRIDAKHSNIGDTFVAKTTEAACVKGKTFEAGSKVYGEVVTVQRPGLGKHPGSVTIKFNKIKNGDLEANFPVAMTSATADKLGNPNIFARVIGLPFSAVARTAGVAGRTVAQGANLVSDGAEEYVDRVGDTFVESFTGHVGSGVKSFGHSFVTLGKGVYGIVKTAVSGTFGVVYEIGDELLYTIVPSVSNSAALNPNEEFTVIF